MKRVRTILFVEKRRVISELKDLTRSRTVKELEAAIPVWLHQYDEAFRNGKSLSKQNNADKAYKALRLKGGISSGVKVFASLNKFKWLHGQLRYLEEMEKAHQLNSPLIPDY